MTSWNLAGLCWVVLACAIGACSLMVDADPVQCREDRDCLRFGNAQCDLARHVCVRGITVSVLGPGADAGAHGADADALNAAAGADAPSGADAADERAPGEPDAPVTADAAAGEDASACSDDGDAGLSGGCPNATCVPFDNRTRLAIVGPDGGLRPLP